MQYEAELALTRERLQVVEKLFYGTAPKAPDVLLDLLRPGQPLQKALPKLLSDKDNASLRDVSKLTRWQYGSQRRLYLHIARSGDFTFNARRIKGTVSNLPAYRLEGRCCFRSKKPFPSESLVYHTEPWEIVIRLNLPAALPPPPIDIQTLKQTTDSKLRQSSWTLRTWLRVLSMRLEALEWASGASLSKSKRKQKRLQALESASRTRAPSKNQQSRKRKGNKQRR